MPDDRMGAAPATTALAAPSTAMARRRVPRRVCLACALLLLLGCRSPLAIVNATPTASPIPFPSATATLVPYSYTPADPLLTQVVTVGPLYVTGDATVPKAALTAAGTLLGIMLRHRPDVVARLRAAGAFTVVSPRDKPICDLTYFEGTPANVCSEYGYGGAGGEQGHPITACDERNLLKEPDDPYQRGQSLYGQNICVHELAHTIMNVGLTGADVNRIAERFLAAQKEGLWAGDYANTNAMEFWAVMSQFYFWAGPNAPYSAFHHIANGPQALQQYDPQTFALLDSIYQGSANLS